jgi:hypothetical protein
MTSTSTSTMSSFPPDASASSARPRVNTGNTLSEPRNPHPRVLLERAYPDYVKDDASRSSLDSTTAVLSILKAVPSLPMPICGPWTQDDSYILALHGYPFLPLLTKRIDSTALDLAIHTYF